MKSSSWWGMVLGVAIILILPMVLGGLLLVQSRLAEESYRWVQHTHKVLAKLDEIHGLIGEAESSQRAYLLTKSEHFETRFRELVAKIPDKGGEFSVLIQDNEAQVKRFDQMQKTLKERIAILDANAREISTLNDQDLNVRLEVGAKKSEQLNLELRELAIIEQKLLDERRVRFEAANKQFQNIAGWTVAGGFLLLSGVGFLLRKESRSRSLYEVRLADARDAALDAVKTTSAFVASVSHEIRTPMNGVLGTADLLLRDATLSAKQRDGIETIRGSGRALLNIINDILDLSKLQAGEMSFVNELYCPEDVVEEVINLFAAAAAKKRIELTPHISADVPQQVSGDRLRLRQVLANLVSNAVKFTESGGISVHVTRRREVEFDGKVCLRFDVSDTGPGIAKEVQFRLFQPFTQVDTKLARQHGGTGLGLAISRELVQRMNGAMGVESTLGHGATFWFTAIFGASDADSEVKRLEDRSIMVLENRPMTADALQAHAVAWGLRPYMYRSLAEIPKEGPNKMGEEFQALIIGSATSQDWLQPLRQLRSREWLRHVPVFLMTDQEELSEHALLREGIVGTLKYPFRPSELYNRLAGSHASSEVVELETKLDLPPSRIIVADDNPVNQRVLRNQLEYLGMEVVLCGHGRQALEAAQRDEGCLILMDCEMPEMDGFEATRAIRRWEKEESRPAIPIIAITAHVMSGDAEQCLESGMNAYLSKPMELEKLQVMLSQWLPTMTKAQSGGADELPNSKHQEPIIDEEQFATCLTGDLELDQDLIQMALKQVEETLEKMQTALQEGADAVWRHAAHRVRGSTGTLGFTAMAALFHEAEFDATSRDARERVLAGLRSAYTQLAAVLSERGLTANLEAAVQL
ncbi:response regulator [Prosthecobacter debontii]|uniref:response regulator n=1 Tax=Prosthecobacter debontii TaxID=48467 RepID=UPI001C37E0C2|nr:response regulator [Prosthecobacter debontii]